LGASPWFCPCQAGFPHVWGCFDHLLACTFVLTAFFRPPMRQSLHYTPSAPLAIISCLILFPTLGPKARISLTLICFCSPRTGGELVAPLLFLCSLCSVSHYIAFRSCGMSGSRYNYPTTTTSFGSPLFLPLIMVSFRSPTCTPSGCFFPGRLFLRRWTPPPSVLLCPKMKDL